MEQGYAICFNKWALDNSIKNELGLLLIISSLSAKEGYCYASNEYLANLFNCRTQTISVKLKNLVNKGYIKIDYKWNGSCVINRKIRLTDLPLRKNITAIKKNINGRYEKS